MRVRLEALPAGSAASSADIAQQVPADGEKKAKRGTSSALLASLTGFRRGKRGAAAEELAAVRDEEVWLPYLGLEKELKDLKVRASDMGPHGPPLLESVALRDLVARAPTKYHLHCQACPLTCRIICVLSLPPANPAGAA